MIDKKYAVRYAFSTMAIENIFIVAGFPVTPFRTDNLDEIMKTRN